MHHFQQLHKVCTSTSTLSFLHEHLFFTVASQKAKYLVSKLNKMAINVECSKPFVFHNQGSLAYIGNWSVSSFIIIFFSDKLTEKQESHL